MEPVALIPFAAGARDPFASFDLDSLASGAARLRPGRPALTDSTGARMNWSELDAAASALAGQLVELGLNAGECLLIAGGARLSGIAAMIACARAGLDMALAPPHLDPKELAAFAAGTGAAAMAGETRYGALAPLDDLFAAAALSPSVRLICRLGEGEGDGAVELDLQGSGPAPARRRSARECQIFLHSGGGVIAGGQQALVAAGLELLSRARIGMRDPIFSALALSGFAGLAAGPFAALLAGCPLHLHGPFDADGFIAGLDACAPAHLAAPRALAEALCADGRPAAASFASLMLTGGARPLFAAPANIPVIDLDGLGGFATARRAPPTSPANLSGTGAET